MALLLPSTVEELNFLQNSTEIASSSSFYKSQNKGFENIVVEKRYKREVSLPNDVKNWNINDIDPYLNFEDSPVSGEFKAVGSLEDRLVPEENDLRQRCESFSSVSSSMDDKRLVFSTYGVKTISTVFADSGSTCISTDHPYGSNPFYNTLDAEETYQNLDIYLQQVPDIPVLESIPSPLSGSSDSNFELSNLHGSFSLPSPVQETFMTDPMSLSSKRPLDVEDDAFVMARPPKQSCSSETLYQDSRRRNATSPKNCRKTRKEKQKEMEVRVNELEKEKEGLKVEVQVLEELIHAHKMRLYAILQKR